jgi:hypothetical protein
MRRVVLLGGLFAITVGLVWAQGGGKQPLSPRGQAEYTFADGTTVTVDYGRPYIRGRKIMGGLVPYDQVWRTGANAATSLKTNANLTIGGAKVPAGNYTLYTLPSAGTWKLIINKETGQWGTKYDPSQDLARVDMQKETLSTPVDQFTISFEKNSATAATMKMEWETTLVSVPVDEVK